MDGFEDAIERRLEEIQRGRALDPTAGPTQSIELAIDHFLSLLNSIAQRAPTIPGELVEQVADWLNQVGQRPAAFSIATDPKVAVLTLRQVAEDLGFHIIFPELYTILDQDEVGNFVVLLVPDRLLLRGSSLDWSVLAHEVGHTYLERTSLVRRSLLPRVLEDTTSIQRKARKGDPEARAFMQLTEYACDEIAVRLTGSVFVWRILTGFFNLEQMSSSATHPEMDKRVRRAAKLAADLGFGIHADQLTAQLEKEIRNLDVPASKDGPVPYLEEISAEIRATMPAVNAADMDRYCREHIPPLTSDHARTALQSGIPVALPGWVVMCLATPDESIHAAAELQEVVADSIRLGQMSSRFTQVMKAP